MAASEEIRRNGAGRNGFLGRVDPNVASVILHLEVTLEDTTRET